MFSSLLSKKHHRVIIILGCLTWGETADALTFDEVVGEPACSPSSARLKDSANNSQCHGQRKGAWNFNGGFFSLYM